MVDTLLTGAAGLPGSHTHTHIHTDREVLLLPALKINGKRRITRRVNFEPPSVIA